MSSEVWVAVVTALIIVAVLGVGIMLELDELTTALRLTDVACR